MAGGLLGNRGNLAQGMSAGLLGGMNQYQGARKMQMLAEQQAQERELKRLEIEARSAPKQQAPIIPLGNGAFWDVAQGKAMYPDQQPKPQAMPSEVQQYEYAKGQGYNKSFADWKMDIARASAMTVPAPMIAAIPPGKTEPEFVTPPARGGGAPQPTGFRPPQTQADFKRAAADANKEQAATSAIAKADQIMGDVDQALKQASPFTTGIIGAGLGVVPGMPAYDLRKTVDTIKANLGFQELQAMRQSSPTGGALGQVAVRELEFLQSTLASLDANQSEPQLRRNLAKVRQHYANWKQATQQSQQPTQAEHPAANGGAWSADKEQLYQEWLKRHGGK
jgi:hypothetical protein